MRSLLIGLLMMIVSGVPAVASGGETSDSGGGDSGGALVARTIQTYEQVEEVRARMYEAVGDLSSEKRAYELALYELKNEPKTAKQVHELAKEIQQQGETLQRYKSQGASADSIAYCKKRIRDLTLILRAGKLQTPQERERFRAQVEPKVEELAARIREIESPYQAKMKAIQAAADEDNQALTELIRPYLKAPESTYPGSKVQHVNATVHMAFGSGNWNDRSDRQVAWAHIRIRSQDEIQDYHRKNLLDGKYPIQSLSDGSIWVWAGNFLITFVADDETITGEENIQDAIHQFIDLESLAAISEETEQVAAGEMIE